MYFWGNFSWKARSQIGRKLGFAASKSVSNIKQFCHISTERVNKLKEDKIKKRTYAKMQWAVKAFREWHSNRMSDVNTFDARIYESDIDRVELLEIDSFQFSVCCFLAEVHKVDGTEYPGKTLYHLIVSLQKHLMARGKMWKLVEGEEFKQIRIVLNNLMKERTKANIGTVKHQAKVIDSGVK